MTYDAQNSPVPAGYQAPAHYGRLEPMAPGLPVVGAIPRKQGAWGVWWLVPVTFGIYYYFWYHRINRELGEVLRIRLPMNGQWWSQLIPIYNLVGLAGTAKRLNAAHAAVNSPTRVGSFTTWFWAPIWFWSQTRYLQRRINILHDILASHAAR